MSERKDRLRNWCERTDEGLVGMEQLRQFVVGHLRLAPLALRRCFAALPHAGCALPRVSIGKVICSHALEVRLLKLVSACILAPC